MLAAAEIHLYPDWTVAIQLAIFLFVLAVLNAMVFRPFLRLLERRKAFTSDAHDQASALVSQAEQAEAKQQETMAEALDQSHAERAWRITKTRREAEKLIADARTKANQIVHASCLEIESSKNAVVDKVSEESEEMSKRIVERVLE